MALGVGEPNPEMLLAVVTRRCCTLACRTRLARGVGRRTCRGCDLLAQVTRTQHALASKEVESEIGDTESKRFHEGWQRTSCVNLFYLLANDLNLLGLTSALIVGDQFAVPVVQRCRRAQPGSGLGHTLHHFSPGRGMDSQGALAPLHTRCELVLEQAKGAQPGRCVSKLFPGDRGCCLDKHA